MKNCEQFQEMLSAYIDDLVQPDEKSELEEHLEKCPQCQQELNELQETVNLIRSLQGEELVPPASFRRELRQKLESTAEISKPQKEKRNLFNISKLQAWLPLAAAAVLLLIITPFVLDLNMWPTKDSSPEIAMDQKMRTNEMPPRGLAGSDGSGLQSKALEENQIFGSVDVVEEEKSIVGEDIEQKIIKTGYLNLEVDNYNQVTASTKEMVQAWGGYIVNENTYAFGPNQNLLAGNITLRVPHQVFDEALRNIEELGTVRNRSSNSQDVTEEYVDIEGRLKAMRLKEERLIDLLAKSGSLGDVLALENELARTRADLEALEGRLKYLNNRTEYSTINLELRETLTPTQQISTTGFKGIMARTQQAFIKTINTIITGLGNLIVFIGGNLPYIVLGLGLLGSGWQILKKYRKQDEKKG